MQRIAFGALLAAMLVSGPTFGAVVAEHRGMLSWQTGDRSTSWGARTAQQSHIHRSHNICFATCHAWRIGE